MLSFQVILLKESCQEEMRMATRNSVIFSASDEAVLTECEQAQIPELLEASVAEVIHFVQAGTIVMPEFYRAMLMTLEHEDKDFVVCRGVHLNQRSIMKTGDAEMDYSQVMVRRWVYQEIGVGDGNSLELVRKATGEYRGIELPHVLTMRI